MENEKADPACVFVLMPFGPEFTSLFEDGIKQGAKWAFKKGDDPNTLPTTLRTTGPDDDRLWACVQECSEPMDEAWLLKNCP